MSTELFESGNNNKICTPSLENELFKTVETCTAESRYLSTRDYIDLLWTTLAEFPGENYEYIYLKLLNFEVICLMIRFVSIMLWIAIYLLKHFFSHNFLVIFYF